MMSAADSATPLGAPVDPSPARRPERVTLAGADVTLAPLDAAHADALYDGSHGDGRESVWAYMGDGPYEDRAAFRLAVEAKARSSDPLFFAIIDNASGRAVGYQTLMRIDAVNRVIETGNILMTPALQRTRGATEAHYLFARYVFDELGYRRYEWKCNDLNAPSRRAALRLGFAFEGIFRQHMIIRGRNRDTAWYAMLDADWPARKAAFERWLAPENFDARGRQRSALVSFH